LLQIAGLGFEFALVAAALPSRRASFAFAFRSAAAFSAAAFDCVLFRVRFFIAAEYL